MTLADQVGPRAGRGYRKLRSAVRGVLGGDTFRGNVDGVLAGELHGWVVRRGEGGGGLSVGLFVPGGMLASTVASQHRGDVQAAGIGDGNCGFVFRLDGPIMNAVDRAGGVVTLHLLGGDMFEIGSCRVSQGTADGEAARSGAVAAVRGNAASRPQLDACRSVLYGDIIHMTALLDGVAEAGPLMGAAPLRRHAALFSRRSPAPAGQQDMEEMTRLPAYLDYTRFRTSKDRDFDPDAVPQDADHFLEWYISVYGTLRNGRRTPLTRDLIDHLNEPIVVGGIRNSMSRAMWWRMMRDPAMRHDMNPADAGWFGRALYWWAFSEARALHVEDCLVSPSQRDWLRAVPAPRKDDAFAFSIFVDHFYKGHSQFHFLNPFHAEDRKTLILCLLVMAGTRPDLLRYIPSRSVVAMLDDHDGAPSAFARFWQELTREAGGAMTRGRYVRALRLQGYDLESHSFLSITGDGDRIEAAARPAVSQGPKVDLQMIGPFKKASGLGQATRLSASILTRTRLTVNHVDFGLDNPAPEGFSKVGVLDGYRQAKVNLIHLNAESVPLVFAYEPDVFSDSYNIGYFFWELDTPAACHYLGMELLDEIWVSTDYGVSIYQPHTDKPVINVGMCFEDSAEIDRRSVRADLNRRFRFDGSEFVCLTAFDSFSFVQRKNPVGVLKAFGKAFEGVPSARLIIKTQNRDNVSDPVQDRIWNQVRAIMAQDPRIVLLNETLGYEALLALKAASDCYISLHKSEGWGFGMIEAMNLKVPVVCTGYSGNLDFCSDETAWLVDCREVALAPDDYIFVRHGQKWAEPDVDHAARQLRAVWSDRPAREARVEAAWANVRQNFSAEAIAMRYEARLKEILKAL